MPAGALVLLAASAGCEVVFPLDRFMGGAADAAASVDDVSPGETTDGPLALGVEASTDDAASPPTSDADTMTPILSDAPDPVGDGSPGQVQYHGGKSARTTDTTLTIATPTGFEVGDLLWLTLYTDHAASVATTPAGWIRQGSQGNATADFHAWWYYRIATDDEPASTTLDISGSDLNVAGLVAWGGVDKTSPFQAGTLAAVSGSPFNAPSLSTMNPGLVLLASFVNDGGDGSTWSPSPPLASVLSGGIVFIGDTREGDAGITGSTSAKCTKNGTALVTVVALNPLGTNGHYTVPTLGSDQVF